eukprot:Blabericola_migrator_1__3260@NODE_195_length_11539_cov_221_635547_g168_i0_p1_GENE_NODE_195_length_11539_cov_221_635547_g168_i0NODE_195_length_11539_cov_221_635547_g168_i0_p1_ORF_typecomplete_len366_score47_93_NODE_195_length_11539_cov_221_635547_g168_i01141211
MTAQGAITPETAEQEALAEYMDCTSGICMTVYPLFLEAMNSNRNLSWSELVQWAKKSIPMGSIKRFPQKLRVYGVTMSAQSPSDSNLRHIPFYTYDSALPLDWRQRLHRGPELRLLQKKLTKFPLTEYTFVDCDVSFVAIPRYHSINGSFVEVLSELMGMRGILRQPCAAAHNLSRRDLLTLREPQLAQELCQRLMVAPGGLAPNVFLSALWRSETSALPPLGLDDLDDFEADLGEDEEEPSLLASPASFDMSVVVDDEDLSTTATRHASVDPDEEIVQLVRQHVESITPVSCALQREAIDFPFRKLSGECVLDPFEYDDISMSEHYLGWYAVLILKNITEGETIHLVLGKEGCLLLHRYSDLSD